MKTYEQVLRERIEFNEKMIEYDKRHLEHIKRMLIIKRFEDKEVKEFVWGKGVVTEMEMKIFTDDYMGTDTKELLKDRQKTYNSIRKWKKDIEKAKKILEVRKAV